MSELSRLGERLIDEAIAAGELTPPPPGTEVDLENYFKTPAEWRAGFAMLRGHDFLPPEVELLKQAETLEKELAGCSGAEERIRQRNRISELRAQFQMALERMRRG
ncbi:DnaJ family domain-containing protein [Luteolibacter marinus]|uniref:DnaJ family domain-containing protein n=1 Tax=Luteolibacter marinus TaxID=2776705 RepID=UPI0018677A65